MAAAWSSGLLSQASSLIEYEFISKNSPLLGLTKLGNDFSPSTPIGFGDFIIIPKFSNGDSLCVIM